MDDKLEMARQRQVSLTTGKDLNPHTLLAGSKMALSLWTTVWQFLKPLNTALAQNPATAFPGLHSGGMQTCPRESVYTPVHSGSIRNSQKVEIIQMSTGGWAGQTEGGPSVPWNIIQPSEGMKY